MIRCNTKMIRLPTWPLVVIAGVLSVFGLPQSTAQAASQPNVILIVADDADYMAYGFMGSTTAKTPSIDALALRGVTFSQAYTQPTCSPALASLLAGMMQHRFGYERNNGNSLGDHNDGLDASQATIFERFKALNYTTAALGKWHVGAVDNYNRPNDQGVDEFYGFLGGGRGYWPGATSNVTVIRRNDTNVEH